VSEEKSPQPIEGSALRAFAGSFASGIVVLTTRDTAGTAYGLTMNAVSSLCVEPPQFLACIAKTAATLGPVLESKVFSLNILAQNQESISNTFASKGDDKFANIDTHDGVLGVPLIDGALGHAEFRLVDTHESGDHVIVIGEAVSSSVEDSAPLVYFRGKYAKI
jgi:flavin reductase (DIM6/NTAB) family NADH-FMN oxidoreductase RutF